MNNYDAAKWQYRSVKSVPLAVLLVMFFGFLGALYMGFNKAIMVLLIHASQFILFMIGISVAANGGDGVGAFLGFALPLILHVLSGVLAFRWTRSHNDKVIQSRQIVAAI